MDTQLRRAILAGVIAAVVLVVAGVTLFVLLGRPSPTMELSPRQASVAAAVELPAFAPEPKPLPLIYPLTGLPAADEATVRQRILSVKIENTPDARPQMGLASADVVYETVTEGGITRFNCLFQSVVPSDVGPVRSGRNSDVTIVPQYDALFFMSGANSLVNSELAAAKIANLGAPKAGDLYYRVNYREAPHNMYLRLDQAFSRAESKVLATVTEVPRALAFSATSERTDLAGASGVGHITVPFSYSYVAEWDWNEDDGRYYRSMDGPTKDVDGRQVSATNVVVLWAKYVPLEFKSTLGLDMNAGGKASIFTDGRRVDGTWASDGKSPPRFTDAQGTTILLTPGQTWFQVIDLEDKITTS
jgi:hypothetical protein